MLDIILNLLSPNIDVYVAPDVFTFSGAGKTVSLGTYLYTMESGGTCRVLAVGESFSGAESCVRVDLFVPSKHESTAVDRFDCLEAFLRFGFIKIAGWRLIKPHVTVHGARHLSERLSGYENRVLDRAALSAGARSVRFKD